jgi:hypothetical protein
MFMQICTEISKITVNVSVVIWCVIFQALAYAIFCIALGKPRYLMMSFNFPRENKENSENHESG